MVQLGFFAFGLRAIYQTAVQQKTIPIELTRVANGTNFPARLFLQLRAYFDFWKSE